MVLLSDREASDTASARVECAYIHSVYCFAFSPFAYTTLFSLCMLVLNLFVFNEQMQYILQRIGEIHMRWPYMAISPSAPI